MYGVNNHNQKRSADPLNRKVRDSVRFLLLTIKNFPATCRARDKIRCLQVGILIPFTRLISFSDNGRKK